MKKDHQEPKDSENKYIKVASEFTECPGGRYKKNGSFSGEEFRNDYLIPRIRQLTEKQKIIIDLDDGDGYGESFLEEAFGGLVRSMGKEAIEKIEIISNDEPELKDTIIKCMKNAKGIIK